MSRVYLDWNATAPLRPDARAAMAGAFDIIGNPSSVHAEGRAAKMLLERSREELAETLGASRADIVFTSGSTEAAALALEGQGLACAGVEHDCVRAWGEEELAVDASGRVTVHDPARTTLQLANSETGVIQDLPQGLAVSDLTQGFGKIPMAFDWLGVRAGFVTAHKLGGPRGIGALILAEGEDRPARLRGGGQESGRRAGTENLAAIAGFAAAAKAAQRDLAAGIPERLAGMREHLRERLEDAEGNTMFPGRVSRCLPQTLSILTPGWKGETQVMQMDLAGFAVSAGSACSSGKVRSSGVLRAMGVAEADAACALRVSFGGTTTVEELDRFAEAWLAARDRWRSKQGRR
ncbi:cysteine desulfurase family protein [Paracoccus sp. MC1862]|uniref:cysteine desulfurase family protein n=1 Tax=Paracoccus sp. MC1862 TaxID=2760307 RepID=UPI001603AFD0|nr:aminotransferase class V-fold PLP-dependent enzyme [Paracoccus sp. MC1862]MBB1497188.1 aminotransferase class V-fold PLP-dependent enzyme [Paracoccus sp. MC1862]QQO44835.1 aminotransferase class V-fold PLP-dependent enzyme [Paracoccus sp. MC1862]